MKTYDISSVLTTLNNKFIIFEEKSVYNNNERINIECNKCKIKSSKTINNRLNSECRNCNMKKAVKDKQANKILNFPGVISYYINKSGNPIVSFICKKCNEKKEKVFTNFVNNNCCTNCATSASATKRENEKGCKKLRFYDNILCINSKLHENQEIELHDEYDDIILKCSQCETFNSDKLWRIGRFIRKKNDYICISCAKSNKLKFSTYNSVKFYNTYPELGNSIGYLYTLKIIINNNICYKIGITRNSVTDRICKISKMFETSDLKYVELSNLECAELEKHYKNKYKEFKILPTVKFDGYTECFTVDIFTFENIKAQRLEIKSRTSEANADGSGQLI